MFDIQIKRDLLVEIAGVLGFCRDVASHLVVTLGLEFRIYLV